MGGTSFDQEIPRFFEGAQRVLKGLQEPRLTKLKRETPRFFYGARQGLDILRPVVIELDRHLARKFNYFYAIALFKSIKAEERMSYVFAYLLDPDGPHGQQDLFLTAFLNHLRENQKTQSAMKRILPDGSTWSHVQVYWEARTTHIDPSKRIDIVISMRVEGKAEPVGIGIESKAMGASDLDNQVSAYAKELHERYGEDFMLIYLTPYATDPAPNSIPCEERKELAEKGQLANASVREWANGWLRRAEDGVKAEQVRWFVADFRKALAGRFPARKRTPSTNVTPAT